MKRRMSATERVRLEAIARPILARYAARLLESEHLRASAQSMTRVVTEALRRGCMVQVCPTNSGLELLSRMQRWLVDMEWVMRELDAAYGSLARHVVLFRLTRPQKTELASFERIAHDVTAICRQLGRKDDLLMPEAEALYRAALPRLVRLFQERAIGCALPEMPYEFKPRMDVHRQRRLIAIGQHLQRFARRRTRRSQRDPNRLHDVRHGARI